METVWKVLKKLKTELPPDAATPHLNIYLKKKKTKPPKPSLTQKDVHPHVYSSIVYNSQDMDQPTCPSMDEWIKKIWHRYTMEYYSAMKMKSCPF